MGRKERDEISKLMSRVQELYRENAQLKKALSESLRELEQATNKIVSDYQIQTERGT